MATIRRQHNHESAKRHVAARALRIASNSGWYGTLCDATTFVAIPMGAKRPEEREP